MRPRRQSPAALSGGGPITGDTCSFGTRNRAAQFSGGGGLDAHAGRGSILRRPAVPGTRAPASDRKADVPPGLGEARILAETARRNQVPYAVNQNYRYCSVGRAVRRLVDEDAVGPIAFVECSAHRLLPAYGYRARERDVMLFEIGVHYIDLLRYWFGSEVAAAQALAPSVPFNSHSSAAVFFALIEMEGGQSASIFASRESRGHTDRYEGRWRLCGPEGSIHVNDLGCGFGVYVDRDPSDVPHLVQASAGTEDGFRPQLEDFARHVREGRPCQTNCFDNLRTLAGCLAIADAYRLGRRVRTAELLEFLAEPAL